MDFRALTPEELGHLNGQRQRAQELIASSGMFARLTGTLSDLPLLQVALRSAGCPDDAVAVGSCYGDVLASELDLEWVVVTDEYGTDAGLRRRGYKLFVFPETMLLKRLERAETPDDIDLTFMLGEIRDYLARSQADAARVEA